MALSLIVLVIFAIDTIVMAQSESVINIISGNVAMFKNGYSVFTGLDSPTTWDEGALTPYNGATQMNVKGKNSTGIVRVFGTMDDATWNINAGDYVSVFSTGKGSNVTVNGGYGFHVKSTGEGSALTVHAEGDVFVESTGKGSTVRGTYGGTLTVNHGGIGEDATVDLQKIDRTNALTPSPTSPPPPVTPDTTLPPTNTSANDRIDLESVVENVDAENVPSKSSSLMIIVFVVGGVFIALVLLFCAHAHLHKKELELETFSSTSGSEASRFRGASTASSSRPNSRADLQSTIYSIGYEIPEQTESEHYNSVMSSNHRVNSDNSHSFAFTSPSKSSAELQSFRLSDIKTDLPVHSHIESPKTT